MDGVDINIPGTKPIKDFTIIYKEGDENDDAPEDQKPKIYQIKTSKEELLKKIRYFKKREQEMNHQQEIYIHDKFKFTNFKKFIESILTGHLRVDESNYFEFYELSNKYEYYELRDIILEFTNQRPDLKKIISELSSDQRKSDNDDDDEYSNDESLKEEIIAQNIDVCLQNGFLNNISIERICRIMKSPKLNLKNHHLLFKFIMDIISKYENENENDEKVGLKENIEILISCLNFKFMSEVEIKELLSHEGLSDVFTPKGAKEEIKTLLNKIDSLEESMIHIKNEQEKILIEMEKYKRICEDERNEISIIKNQLLKHENSISQIESNQKIHITKQEEVENKIHEQTKNIANLATSLQTLHEEQEKERMEKERQEKVRQEKERQEKERQERERKERERKERERKERERKEKERKERERQKEFLYQPNKEFDGIIKYLQMNSNNNKNNEIDISSSSIYNNVNSCAPENAIKFNERTVFESGKEKNPFLCIKFKNHRVIPKNYSIRSGHFRENEWHPRSWVIEGKNEGLDWEIIDSKDNCPSLNGFNIVHTFSINNPENKSFQYLRIRKTGPNWDKVFLYQDVLVIDSIEFYGILI